MESIQIFNNKAFGNLRVMVDNDGEPWFVGKVVAELLGYVLPQKAINEHVEFEDSKVLTYKAFSKTEKANSLWEKKNDYSNKTLINESGLYSLILGSKLPQAKAFKRWVTHEVLPQIRRTGSYFDESRQFGTAYYGENKAFNFLPDVTSRCETEQFVMKGVGRQNEDGTFSFTATPPQKRKSVWCLKHLPHGRVSVNEVGTIRLTLTFNVEEDCDFIRNSFLNETFEAVNVVDDFLKAAA